MFKRFAVLAALGALLSCAMMGGGGSGSSVDSISGAVETTLAAAYRTTGDLRRQDKITGAQKDDYIRKLDALKETERIAQDADVAARACAAKATPGVYCPPSGTAAAIISGASAGVGFIYGDLLAKQGTPK